MFGKTSSIGTKASLAAGVGLLLGLQAIPAHAQDSESATDERGVFIEQVGVGNRADVSQAGSNGRAQIVQDGASNVSTLTQGAGVHSATIVQSGDENSVLASQDGIGETELLMAQEGSGNFADVSQADGGLLYSAAAILQNGNGNSLSLVQNGDDNQARLTQNGDNNAMTAVQLDAGNRLEWTQDGSGLSDLQITQTGGAAMQVTQTNSGGGN